jgi:hypothetical protein
MDIDIAEDPTTIDSMVVTFNGFGASSLTLNTYIWNYNSSSWQVFDNAMSIGTSDSTDTATYNPVGDFTNFVNAGQITIVITDSTLANLNWSVDYVKLDVNFTAGDTLTASGNTNLTVGNPTEGDTGVDMQRFQVDCSNDDDSSCWLSSLTIQDDGNASSLTAYVYIDTVSQATLPGSATLLGNTSGWDGSSTVVNSFSDAAREVQNGTSKYVYIVYDIPVTQGGNTIQSNVTAVSVDAPDTGAGAVGTSTLRTVQSIPKDTLTASANTNLSPASPEEESTGVEMQRFQVDSDNVESGTILLNSLTIQDDGNATSLTAYVYIDTVSQATLPGTAVLLGNTSGWDGSSTAITLSGGTPADRTVSFGASKYIYIVYDIPLGQVGNTIQSNVTAIGVVAPDIGSGAVGTSTLRTVAACTDSDPSTITLSSGQTVNGDPYDVTSIYGTTGDVGTIECKVTTGGSGTTTYDYSTGAGTTKWAYDENDTNTSVPPATRTTVNTVLSAGEYTAISTDNAAYYTNTGSWGDANALRMDINIAEDPTTIDSMVVTFNGFGASALALNTYIWNYNSSSWQVFDNAMSIGTSDSTDTATYDPVGDFTNFVSGGQITIVITDSITTALETWSVDYVKLDVNAAAETTCTDWTSSCNSIPASGTPCDPYVETVDNYNLYVRGTDPDCGGTPVTGSPDPEQFTWNACTETDTITLTVASPITGATVITAGGTAANKEVRWREDGGSWSSWMPNGSTYTPTSCGVVDIDFEAQGDGSFCGGKITATDYDNTFSDSDVATLTISDPITSSTVSGIYTIQVQIGVESAPDTMNNMAVTVSGTGGGTCDVSGAAMAWNAGTSRWEYNWNTNACGDPVESGITIYRLIIPVRLRLRYQALTRPRVLPG